MAHVRSRRSTKHQHTSATSTTSKKKVAKKSKKPSGAKRGIEARWPWKESPNPYFEIRESSIQGRGAFAIRNIKKGTRIIEYLGQRISWRTADKRYDDEKMRRHHTFLFTIDDKTCIDGAVKGNEAAYLNHSCDGNCEAINDRKRIFIDAVRSIKAGEELTIDYQMTLWFDPVKV